MLAAINNRGLMLDIIQVDYCNQRQAQDLLLLLDAYARDPMGGGQALSAYTRQNLLTKLAEREDALSLLAYKGNRAVGLVNAFEGFSTFQCRPLLNIHDVCVDKPYRRQGIASAMLRQIELIARERCYCKLTLEVLQANEAAKRAYQGLGFKAYELDPQKGQALFWEKAL